MSGADSITIARPDDWHVHLRDGAMLRDLVGFTARQFARAIVMPNLSPPVIDMASTAAYRNRILAAVPPGMDFTPLMTCYLTDDTDPDDLARGADAGVFTAAKLYPANATTNSAQGVSDMRKLYRVFERMEAEGIVLCVHGEVTDPDVDVFDREAEFIERHLREIVSGFPKLKVVFEHITTREAVNFVLESAGNVAATITPQHLHLNRNAMLVGGIRPHAYCLPVPKREAHRLALRKAATSGDPRFFLGTDSAPHVRRVKESACGCAGIFNAPYAIESYCAVFDEEGALDQLEGFASRNGPAFYGLPVNEGTITLERAKVKVPAVLSAAGEDIVPFHAGETLSWRLVA